MSKKVRLEAIRALEERLKSATPTEAGKFTKKLVKLKEKWLNG